MSPDRSSNCKDQEYWVLYDEHGHVVDSSFSLVAVDFNGKATFPHGSAEALIRRAVEQELPALQQWLQVPVVVTPNPGGS